MSDQGGRQKNIVVGITGASGALYAQRFLTLAARADVRMRLIVSTTGRRLLFEELGHKHVDLDALTDGHGERVTLENNNDLGAAVASGSFKTDGMIICPCTSNTLGSIASGVTTSLIQRAAMVSLKERRRLVLVHRETPLSTIDIRNMSTATDAGAIVAPANPGFYLGQQTIAELVDSFVVKLLDLFDIQHELDHLRWKADVIESAAEQD